ncbi:MAG: hypothetical protein AVDCRST_MAG64-2821, partial [uncultured Phycisphaerae bacterium]
GNFLLTRFAAGVTQPAAAGTVAPIAFRNAQASFEQANYPIAAALDDKPDTGWAVSPMMGRPASATFFPKVPIVAADGGARLTFTLEFNSPAYAGFSLGRFRLWVLGAADPASAPNIPAEVQDILKVADANRTPEQRVELAAYYRSISPALEPTRQRLAELRARVPQMPIVVARNRGGAIPVPVNRSAAFAGPVQVTLEGFSAGRDPQTRQPTPVAKNFDVTPLTLAPDAAFGKLAFKPRNNSELGTRMVVLRAEAKIGDDTYVQYSPAFPITVTEK